MIMYHQVYYDYLVEFERLSSGWMEHMLGAGQADMDRANERLRGDIAALQRRSSAAEEDPDSAGDESTTSGRFARTTMLTRMVKAYLQLEAARGSVTEPVRIVLCMLVVPISCVLDKSAW